jgi:hypothetical protein
MSRYALGGLRESALGPLSAYRGFLRSIRLSDPRQGELQLLGVLSEVAGHLRLKRVVYRGIGWRCPYKTWLVGHRARSPLY